VSLSSWGVNWKLKNKKFSFLRLSPFCDSKEKRKYFKQKKIEFTGDKSVKEKKVFEF
jgi:hypothetical protein